MASEISSNTTKAGATSTPATQRSSPTSSSSSTNSPTCLQIVVVPTKTGVRVSVKSLKASCRSLLKKPARQEYILLLPPNVPPLNWSRETLRRTSLLDSVLDCLLERIHELCSEQRG